MIDTLQYLGQDELKRYLAYLVAHQQHFTHDHTYLRVAHGEHLKPVKEDKKKDTELVLSCLSSQSILTYFSQIQKQCPLFLALPRQCSRH
jgi:hypothetical protein